MKNKWLVFTTGFALFSMFFGSGNLVFPISAGTESEGHVLLASLGIILTGVVVPFLGVFGMMLYKGDFQAFFSSFGKRGTFLFSLLVLGIMGPFGCFSRCLTVAHGSIQVINPNISLFSASLVMSVVIYLLGVNKNKIVNLLGTWLTPFLILSLVCLTYFGLTGANFQESSSNGFKAFKNGFFEGYQTMDLLASFFFSTFTISYLNNKFSEQNSSDSSLKLFAKSSLVGASILSLVYIVMVLLGSGYSSHLAGVPPQEMLGRVAVMALGNMGAPCLCIFVVLACLTTAIVLASLFADFIRTEVFKERLGRKSALSLTIAIGFLVSLLEFSGIAKFIGPIMTFIYPALIVHTLVCISHKLWGMKSSHWPVTVTVVAKLCSI